MGMTVARWGSILAGVLFAPLVQGQNLDEKPGDDGLKRDAAGSATVSILELSHFSGKTLEEVEQNVWVHLADQVDPLRIFISGETLAKARIASGKAGGMKADIESGGYSGAEVLVSGAKSTGEVFQAGEWNTGVEDGEESPLIWETMPRAMTDADLEGRWRLFLKRKQIRGEADTLVDIAGLGKIAARLGGGEIRDLFLDAVAGAFDPNSEYQRPYRKVDFAKGMSLTGTTTGIEVSRDDRGKVVVKESLEGGPEEGSEVLSVGVEGDGEVEVENLSDAKLQEMVGGATGDGVRLEVSGRDGEVRTVEVAAADDPLNKENRARAELILMEDVVVGLFSVPSLYGWGGADAGGDFRRLAERLVRAGAQALVLDLRGNSGGSVDEAREMAGVFLGKNTVALGVDRSGNIQAFSGLGDASVCAPVVCLVDAETGSAAEILAGALQYHGRGIVLGGGATRGKGTAQTVLDLGSHGFLGKVPDEHLGAVRVSTMLLYTPGGRAIQGAGIRPDIVLPCGLEAARMIGQMRGTGESPIGKPKLTGWGGSEKADLRWRRGFKEVSKMSQRRTAESSFFSKTGEILGEALEIIAANSLERRTGGGVAGVIGSLHSTVVEGKVCSLEVVAADAVGPARGESRTRLLDPYEGEAVAIAFSLAKMANTLPKGAGGVGSGYENK